MYFMFYNTELFKFWFFYILELLNTFLQDHCFLNEQMELKG